MKRHLLIAAFMLFATTSVFAQTEKTVIIKEGNDGDETVTIVKKVFQSRLHQTLPDWYYGILNLNSSAFGPEAHVPLRSSSFEWGTYNQHTVFATRNNVFGMTWGFGISNSYNFFSHDVVLRKDNENKAYFQLLDDYSQEEGNGPRNAYAHRSFLRYWSLRLPVMFQLQWEVNNDNYLAFAAGVEAELRFGVRSFARYGGSKHHVIDNFNYEPVGLNAIFSLAADNAIIFCRMGLTDFFNVKDTKGDYSDMYQMTIGFGFNFD